ncbi:MULTISPECIES: helix-turn-helix domain-containing protein [unclassified Actinotignum]|uniref:helix-turn-helix domain-containing protein n=1 Tax=unclassified Actinotignum TaxID=2632702 RepID=UPI003F459580
MRESKGISQELVARRLGTTAERIDELEGRGINPTLQELHSYAVAIGVAIEYNVRDLDAE